MSPCDYDTKSPQKLQVLHDNNFPWAGRKYKTIRLAHLYDLAGYRRYGDRVAACASWLQFAARPNPDDVAETVRTLTAARFCDLRLCPMCNARKAKRAAILLSKVLTEYQRRRAGTQYVFATLTVRNVTGPELGDAITNLCHSWRLLTKQRQVCRSTTGWFRAVEVTRNKATGEYHPHIHAILAVDYNYFSRASGKYISHDEWVTRWQEALRVDYRPSVHVEATKGKAKDGRRRKSRDEAAAEEAAKYATKDAEYIGPTVTQDVAVEIVRTYTEALARKRLTAFGGGLKVVARLLDADNLDDGDLVHLDGDVREDLLTAIETYRWHIGIRDYVLDSYISTDE